MNYTCNVYKEQSNPFRNIKKESGKYRTEAAFLIPLRSLANSKRGKVVCDEKDAVKLDRYGNLYIRSGWLFDGATGAFETPSNILAALVHDALYALLRDNKKSVLKFSRAKADKIYRAVMKAQGAKWWRRWGHWTVIRVVAWSALCIALAFCSGCFKLNVEGDWVHRGQVVYVGTNAIPETVNIDNLQEGGNANLEGNLNAIKK
jgi:hypothetical protein